MKIIILLIKIIEARREGGAQPKSARALRAQAERDLTVENRQLGILQEQREAVLRDTKASDDEIGKYFSGLDVKSRITFIERIFKAGIAPDMVQDMLGLNIERLNLGFANALNKYEEAMVDYSDHARDQLDGVSDSQERLGIIRRIIGKTLARVKREHMADPLTHVAPQGIGPESEEWEDKEEQEEKREAERAKAAEYLGPEDKAEAAPKKPPPKAPPATPPPPPPKKAAPPPPPPDDDEEEVEKAADDKVKGALNQIFGAISGLGLGDKIQATLKETFKAAIETVTEQPDKEEEKKAPPTPTTNTYA